VKSVADGTSGRLFRVNGCKAALQNALVEVAIQIYQVAQVETAGASPSS
jgi:hypothetical protein